MVQDYITDPLNTVGPAAVRTGAQILAAFRDLAPKYKELQLPLYAAHGTLVRWPRVMLVCRVG